MDAKFNSTPGLSDLHDAFRLLDRDKNGTLDLQEPVMASLGLKETVQSPKFGSAFKPGLES